MLWLFGAFIVLPVVEIWLITRVAAQVGWGLALILVVGVSLAGAWLVRREGLGVIRRVQSGFGEARLPTNELADGAMIFFAAALMLTPGFLTDALGLALLIPPIRALLRPPVIAFFRRRLEVRVSGVGGGFPGPGGPTGPFGRGPGGRRGDVIDVDERSGPDQPDDPPTPRPELD